MNLHFSVSALKFLIFSGTLLIVGEYVERRMHYFIFQKVA